MVSVGGEEFKWCQAAHNQLWSQQGPHFSPHSTAKTNDKSTSEESDEDYDYEEKKSQEPTVFSSCQKVTSAMKLRPEKQ